MGRKTHNSARFWWIEVTRMRYCCQWQGSTCLPAHGNAERGGKECDELEERHEGLVVPVHACL